MPIPHTGANYGGGTHFVKAVSANPIRQNGGTIFYGGTVASNSPITNSIGWPYIGFPPKQSEPGPYISTYGVAKALSNGTFGKQTAGRYILFGYTNYIAGIANTLLSIQANYGPHFSQNPFHSPIRSRNYIITGGWNYVTGRGTPAWSFQSVGPEVGAGTWALPGKITYLSTGKTPTTQVLPAKTD